MNFRTFTYVLGLFAALSIQPVSAAWIASADQLQIDQNGATVWYDDFSTDTSASYNSNLPITVGGGRAQMYSRDGEYGVSGISNNVRWLGRARVNNWLYDTDTFLVNSVFDIVSPDAEGRYGMRLNDACTTCVFDDLLDLALYFNPAGEAYVRYQYNDDLRRVVKDGFDFRQESAMLDLAGFEQIAFFFRNDGDGLVDAGYLLLETAGTFDLTTMAANINWFDTGYYAFNTENRLRAELLNVEFANVPEASTALVLALGLFGLGMTQRRRRQV